MADKNKTVKKEDDKKPVCGIIMPISEIDGCSEKHWGDILGILKESIEMAGFEPNLVSDSDDVGIIQKRIVQNIYENDIVVCDVSGKNANVMFELGLRLAFDKPAIVIKDDKTSYSFDTSPIEHLGYPRDLRFGAIVDFKENLANKIKATVEAAKNNPEYTTFLKHFGTYKVAQLEQREVSEDEYIMSELGEIKSFIRDIRLSDFSRDRSVRKRHPSAEDWHPCISPVLMAEIVLTIEAFRQSHGLDFDNLILYDEEIRRLLAKKLNSSSHFDAPSEYKSFEEGFVRALLFPPTS